MNSHYAIFPSSLHVLAWISVVLGIVSAAVVVIDEFRRPQKMWIMNLVWPLTTLFGGLIWLGAYFIWGRPAEHESSKKQTAFAVMVFKGSNHCGAGCTLGDIIVEWLTFAFPVIAVWFGWPRVFNERTFAVWIPDSLLALLLGVAFQHFTIKPMRKLSPGQGIVAALKADIASITAWQLGMCGVMALIQLGWFKSAYNGIAPVAGAEFWFAMQIAMLGGFVTSYPVNWALIRAGWKERM